LDRFNEARYKLLEKLEEELFTGDCEWMVYYKAIASRKKSWYAEFKVLRMFILAVYVLAIGLVVWANVSSERLERERREISAAMDSATPNQAANHVLDDTRP
jgi:tRNA(Glu) U13 pseudouridine synthase TruD